MAWDRSIISNYSVLGGGVLSVAASGGQFLAAGSNILANDIGSTTAAFGFNKIDLAPGGSNNTVPVGYATTNNGSGTYVNYVKDGWVICPAAAAIAAGDHLQVEGEASFRAVIKAVTASGIIGTALNSAGSNEGVIVQLGL